LGKRALVHPLAGHPELVRSSAAAPRRTPATGNYLQPLLADAGLVREMAPCGLHNSTVRASTCQASVKIAAGGLSGLRSPSTAALGKMLRCRMEEDGCATRDD